VNRLPLLLHSFKFQYPGWEYGIDLTFRHLCNLMITPGRLDKATEALRRAIQVNPEDAVTHAALAWLLATCPDDVTRSGAVAAGPERTDMVRRARC